MYFRDIAIVTVLPRVYLEGGETCSVMCLKAQFSPKNVTVTFQGQEIYISSADLGFIDCLIHSQTSDQLQGTEWVSVPFPLLFNMLNVICIKLKITS